VSVVICAYNEEALLAEVCAALFRQDLPHEDYELVLVDDESTDRTPDIAEAAVEMARANSIRATYVRIRHAGLSAARNAGIAFSQAEIIAFLDGDAIPAESWLRELTVPFATPDVGLVGGRVDLLNTDAWWAALSHRIRHRQVFDGQSKRNHFIGCNMAIRKGVFDALGGFHNVFSARGDEVSLFVRASHKGFRYAAAQNAVVKHERPGSLREWIGVEWKSKTLAPLVRRAVATEPFLNMRMLLRLAKGLTYSMIPLLLVVSLLYPVWAWSLLAVLGVLLFDSLARGQNRETHRALIGTYGVLQSSLYEVIFTAGEAALTFWGFVVGSVRYAGTAITPPFFDRDTILHELHSDEEARP